MTRSRRVCAYNCALRTHPFLSGSLLYADTASEEPATNKATDALARAREVLRSMESRRGARPHHVRSGTFDASDNSAYQRQISQGLGRTATIDVSQMAAARRISPAEQAVTALVGSMPFTPTTPVTGPQQRTSAIADNVLAGNVPQSRGSFAPGVLVPLSGANAGSSWQCTLPCIAWHRLSCKVLGGAT
jgi:hypothetical protein